MQAGKLRTVVLEEILEYSQWSFPTFACQAAKIEMDQGAA